MSDLEYIGDGAYLVGVPARDIAEAEVAALGLDAEELLRSGLYQEKPDPQKED